jgi:hypothetical protein
MLGNGDNVHQPNQSRSENTNHLIPLNPFEGHGRGNQIPPQNTFSQATGYDLQSRLNLQRRNWGHNDVRQQRNPSVVARRSSGLHGRIEVSTTQRSKREYEGGDNEEEEDSLDAAR